jgi:hypothetical protein
MEVDDHYSNIQTPVAGPLQRRETGTTSFPLSHYTPLNRPSYVRRAESPEPRLVQEFYAVPKGHEKVVLDKRVYEDDQPTYWQSVMGVNDDAQLKADIPMPDYNIEVEHEASHKSQSADRLEDIKASDDTVKALNANAATNIGVENSTEVIHLTTLDIKDDKESSSSYKALSFKSGSSAGLLSTPPTTERSDDANSSGQERRSPHISQQNSDTSSALSSLASEDIDASAPFHRTRRSDRIAEVNSGTISELTSLASEELNALALEKDLINDKRIEQNDSGSSSPLSSPPASQYLDAYDLQMRLAELEASSEDTDMDEYEMESVSAGPGKQNEAPNGAIEKTKPGVIFPGLAKMRGNDEDEAMGEDDTLYCICRKPDNHEWMIACDGGCDDWFHGYCVGLTKADGQRIDRYICPDCENSGRGQTVWKD